MGGVNIGAGERMSEKKLRVQEIMAESRISWRDFPGGTVVKNLPANVGDTGWIPGPGRFHMPRSN